jgi:hypothetical protein
MSQCVRCSKPCAATSSLCEECQAFLRLRPPAAGCQTAIVSAGASDSRSQAETAGEQEKEDEPPERSTDPRVPAVTQGPLTPPPEIPADLALEQLTAPEDPPEGQTPVDPVREMEEAARFLSESRGFSSPPRARLASFQDISETPTEIQSDDSSLPAAPGRREEAGEGAVRYHQQGRPAAAGPPPASSAPQAAEDLQQRLPDLWPWIQDADEEESDAIWLQRTDPLLSRRMPTGAEGAAIDAEDIRRARAAAIPTTPLSTQGNAGFSRPLYPRRWRRVAFILLMVALLALGADLLLFSLLITRQQAAPGGVAAPPMLTLTPNVTTVGQTVRLSLQHFSPAGQVLLSHDIQQPVSIRPDGASLVTVDRRGNLVLEIRIDAAWGAGLHLVEAEDIRTRYTASATLEITGRGLTQPAHLVIAGPAHLVIGADYQGANSILPLTLRNAGSGLISWQASSNQPWLLLSPAQGLFSASQTIWIAVQRAHLKPGNYTGTVTFTSDVGGQQQVTVTMSVRPLPVNAGPVLQVTPAALSFIAQDGGTLPPAQSLTITNIGNRALDWALSGQPSLTAPGQTPYAYALGPLATWLEVSQRGGSGLESAGSETLNVSVSSRSLLPGVYTAVLLFAAPHGVLNTPQRVVVSLSILPRCGIMVNATSLSFTSVAGQSNPANQAVTLSKRAGCVEDVSWQAAGGAPWLTITPASGDLQGTTSIAVVVGVKALGLAPGTYNTIITFTARQSSQTLPVRLVVQPPPPPGLPVIGATPLSLNFSAIQGEAKTPPQVVVMTNSGGSTLYWQASQTMSTVGWLSISPGSGSILPGGSGNLLISVSPAGLTPGTYSGQIFLTGRNAAGVSAPGTPQILQVTFQVLPPCVLGQPSAKAILFNAIAGGSDPVPQTVTLEATGSCSWPLSWSTSLAAAAPWLKITDASTTLVNGQLASIALKASVAGLAVGSYSAQVNVAVLDSEGERVTGSPQSFTVTLNVLPPCIFQVGSSGLTFTVAQGAPAPPAQTIAFSSSGTCQYPLAVSAAPAAGSSWLSASAGSDQGSGGSIQVSVNPSGLPPGVYNSQLTLTASGGGAVQNNVQVVPVTLIVNGYTISGSVEACADSSCASPTPLAGATVTLYAGTTQVARTTADSAGNYSFANVPLGSYTLTATGSDSQGKQYTGSASVTISGNQVVNINAVSS